MDEWAVRGAVMKTGLEGKKVKVRCRRGDMKETESGVWRKNEKCSEKWRRQRGEDGE